jgi:hypothetical protein
MSVLRKEPVPYLNVPLSDALLTVDTRDGLRVNKDNGYYVQSGQSPYDINIYKSQQLFSGAVERIALTEINMPYNIPNVNKTNNVLYIKPSPLLPFDDVEIVIDEGFYTPVELANAIRQKLNGIVFDGAGTPATPIFGVDPTQEYWDCFYMPKGASSISNDYFTYDATKTYSIYNFTGGSNANRVFEDNIFYESLQNGNIGNTPYTSPAFWQPIGGEKAKFPIAGGGFLWNNTTSFATGTYCLYQATNGKYVFYKSLINANVGNVPETSPASWEYLRDWQTYASYYDPATTYIGSEVVLYAGYEFIAKGTVPPGFIPTDRKYWEPFPIDVYVGATTSYGSAFCIYNTAGPINVIQFQIDPRLGLDAGNVGGVPRRDTLATMMGFASSSPADYSPSIIGNYATCVYTSYIDIVSDIICKHQDVRDTSTNYATGNNILARVYISPDIYESISDTGNNIVATRPFVLHYNLPVPKQIQWSPYEFLPSANIQLRDDKGQLLYAPNLTSSTVLNSVPGFPAIAAKAYGNTSFVQLTFQISEAKA